MTLIFSSRCIEYEFLGHPESPERLKSIYNLLKSNGFEFIEPSPAKEKEILRVHTKDLFKKVKGGGFLDSDTPSSKKMFECALLSCGAAIKAKDLALNNISSFSVMRPPGHHAGRDTAGGFCYFNNIAVAVMLALDKIEKTAIVDIDCHHGNGTEDIFLGNEKVLYVSLHQSPLYPGTGLKSQKNCLNFPLPAGTKEEQYLAVLKKALEEVKRFSPQLIAVSAGFDTYKNDPLTGLGLEIKTYSKMSGLISSLNKPVFSVLEGGYSSQLAECVREYIEGW